MGVNATPHDGRRTFRDKNHSIQSSRGMWHTNHIGLYPVPAPAPAGTVLPGLYANSIGVQWALLAAKNILSLSLLVLVPLPVLVSVLAPEAVYVARTTCFSRCLAAAV